MNCIHVQQPLYANIW